MFRLFLALNLLFLNLYACEDGIESCRQKTLDSKSIVNQTLQIPLQNNQRLIFSKTPPSGKIIKHDPYLSLYLVEDKNNFKFPFRINKNVASGTFGVDNKKVIEGKIVKRQEGLKSFAIFSERLSTPSLLLNSCCALEGIVTERGIIEKEYIERFLRVKKVTYGDFGVEVKTLNSAVVVESSNPFVKGNLLKKGDIILELDGKKVKDSAKFMRDVFFSEIGSTHKIKVKRGNETITVTAKTQSRKGGGYLKDVYLEFLGLSFDENLAIEKIAPEAKHYGLKEGDKLLQINTKNVKSQEDIFNIINDSKNSTNLLFQRDQFQFFVKVN